MIARSRLSPVAAARLLWAAALFDAAFVFLLLQIVGTLVRAIVSTATGISFQISADRDIQAAVEIGVGLVFYALLLVCYWALCEIALGGRSLGRFCLMLSLRQAGGGRPGVGQTTRRGLHKIASFGLAGLSLRRPDRYDAAGKLVWHSPMAAGTLAAARGWKVHVLSGGASGKTFTLERLEGFDKYRAIRIGRDPNWSDIVLDRDERVSSQHAVIRLSKGAWSLMDYGGGRGSSNRTFLKGQAIPPGKWVRISAPVEFAAADVRMRLDRA